MSLGRQLTIGGQTMVVTFSGRNLTNAYQGDLDEGPLRDATYVYGPRYPLSAVISARMEF